MPAVSRVLPVAADVAWQFLTDTRAWPEWGPSVRAVDCPTRHIGPGVRGRVRTPGGVWIRFVITEWEEGRSWAWRVAGVPATGHLVEPVDDASCRVSFLIPRWAPFYAVVCDVALDRLEALARRHPS